MDHIVFVSKVEGCQELGGEPTHNRVRDHILFEPSTKAPQRLSHELKYKADMSSVWPSVLEVVDEVANILVAELATVSIPKMGEDLSLKDGLVLVVAHGTEHL